MVVGLVYLYIVLSVLNMMFFTLVGGKLIISPFIPR